MKECYEDPLLFLRTFLPHWFTRPLPWAHRGMLAILLRKPGFLLNFGEETWPEGKKTWTRTELDKIIKHFVWRETPSGEPIHLFELGTAPDGTLTISLSVTQHTQIVWPRGFGKTTIVNAANIFKIVYKLRKFLVYLSETATHAEAQLRNVQLELSGNTSIIQVFGKQKPERADDEVWRADFCETTGGVAIQAKGRGGQVRGMLHRHVRPDDITVDDVEDPESVATPAQRLKTRVWFKADVEPALNHITKNGVINMIGTILHREALIPTIMGDPDWISIVFGALDPDGEPLWPEYMTLEEFEKKKLSFIRAGMLSDFYREFASQITNAETAKFKGPFRYETMKRSDFVAVALVEAPAISASKTADFCAFAVTGITSKGQHHILEVYGEVGMTPRDQIEKYFELHFKWQPTHHGIEAIAFQQALVHIMREEMFRKAKKSGAGAYFEITPIRHGKQGKIPRVEGALAPRFASGYITLQQPFPLLEQQLLDWPLAKLDLPDVVAMCVTLLDPYAATAFDPSVQSADGVELEVDDILARDVYEELGDDYYRGAP